MKILLIGKPTDAYRMCPPENALQLFEATLQGAVQQREEGKILEFYSTPTGCSVVVLNYDSADEWMRDQTKVPGINLFDWEIYPLADGFENMKGAIASMKEMLGK